jgi:Uma2 family endonuclease
MPDVRVLFMTKKHDTSPATYLSLERKAEIKSEYVGGHIRPMMWLTKEHTLINTNLSNLLQTQLNNRCNIYQDRMKVRTHQTYRYPATSILCTTPIFEDEKEDVLLNPTVVFDIYAVSPEGYDEGEKFVEYRTIKSLQSYVLISQLNPRVELYQREGENWIISELKGRDKHLEITSINCNLNLAELYTGVFTS